MLLDLNNIIFTLDSYKQVHPRMYPDGTEYVYTYGEARKGGDYAYSTWVGLQYQLIRWLEGVRVTKELIDQAEPLLKEHFKYCGDIWERSRWDYIVEKHGGRLPVVIKAAPEGMNIPEGNVLITIENTDPNCFWLTNALETLLQHVWYTTTVATRSNHIVNLLRNAFKDTVDDDQAWLVDFYLHDFGQRAVSCMEQAGLGGMAHLVNSQGSDSNMAILYAMKFYDAKKEGLCYSVPASEHSIATALGKDKEFDVTKRLMSLFPQGILSVVSDSYDIENAVHVYCGNLKEDILNRKGKFVIRPDSLRSKSDTPAQQVLWIAQELEKGFGVTINSKGYKVLHPKVGIIYGDGLSENDILEIVATLVKNKFAASACVFGQGGGLLQKLNRDTCRYAFKSSAQRRNGVLYDIYKQPKDESKASKKGKLKLVWDVGAHAKILRTVPENDPREDQLVEVFRDGVILKRYTFDEVRKNALSMAFPW